MKKTLISAMLLVGIVATAQDARGRVGINNDAPKASLHIGRHTGISANSPQGLILPHLTTAQRNEFNLKTQTGQNDVLVEGLMIYNTEEKCVEVWNGIKWSCVDGSQTSNQPATPVSPLPEGVTIGSAERFIVSIYDNNYLPYTRPTSPADFSSNGTGNDPLIDVQGVLTTTGIDVDIPVSVSGGGTKTIPAFTSSPITIPADRTEDNSSRDVVLTWEEQPVSGTSGTIRAKVKTLNGELKVKQLDMNRGIGADYKGVLLGRIKYPSSSATDSNGSSFELRAIAGVPDRSFADANHQFIYVPMEITVNGKRQIWLNNNLGANYANINKKDIFNPAQQAKYYGDHNAYGSLFQWGREADGHELMDWTNLNTGVPKNSAMPWKSVAQLSTYTENCPVGFRLPNKDEYTALREEVNKGSDNAKAFVSLGLRFPNSSHRINTNGTVTDRSDAKPGIRFYLWSSTPSEASNAKAYSVFAQANNIDAFNANNDRSYGFALRCVADTSTDSGSNGGGVTPVPPPPGGGGNGGGSNGGTPIQLPANVTLSSSEKFVVSIYDNDYLPYSVPTAGASYASKAADGNADPLVDIQGSINTVGETVSIPVAVQGGGSATIPAYRSASITVPVDHIQCNVGQQCEPRQLVLTWDEQTVSGANTFINAKIKTVDGVLNIKKLDINNGIGSDARGVQLGNAKIEYPASTSTQGAQQKATLDLRAIAGIPDKKFNVRTNGELEHQFIYLPIQGPDGRTWLNNNLGADYANVNKTGIFNPAQQAKSKTDHLAYGSLFEWGRDADGHELIDWTGSTSSSGTFRKANLQNYNYGTPNNPAGSGRPAGDPCPAGYHTPSKDELQALLDAVGIGSAMWNENTLKLPASGDRSNSSSELRLQGNGGGYYWSRSEDGSYGAWSMGFNGSDSNLYSYDRTYGSAVRCIKN